MSRSCHTPATATKVTEPLPVSLPKRDPPRSISPHPHTCGFLSPDCAKLRTIVFQKARRVVGRRLRSLGPLPSEPPPRSCQMSSSAPATSPGERLRHAVAIPRVHARPRLYLTFAPTACPPDHPPPHRHAQRVHLHVCRMSSARDSSGRLLVWPVAAVATTRSRAAWWHLLLLQGGYRDAQRPKLTKTLLCCVLGVPWHLVVHVDCSGHPCSLLGACTCCGQGWRCVGRQWCCGSCTVRAVPVPVCSAPLACRLARWYIHDV